ncbi:hypothetical protein HOP50_04g30160 [Chloropicon primus]|uniref:Trichohyalin-plectin-homology domain-containing protein n=1 Tax=Chloropicon primus TaxID=1764295 RepID=A0A5B8MIN7_9CHLO|nr:hypothetical protein A3770_04p30160 [Chloropicon primus]UPQ99708.1 hypothetical protein HOP50_04g30160 [Chloropicon primus]|eukprot:QDZ20498.1 hypothetical protein A3770_04p30160 [Chloropicon primus]
MVSEAGSTGKLSKRERLELILEKEKEKDRLENKMLVKHTPAQYRKLLLSTSNRTIGSTDDLKATKTKPSTRKAGTPTSMKRVVASAENKKRNKKMETVKSLLFDAPDGYQSAFQGKRPSKTAVAMKNAKEKSAWAKIAQFEQDMYSLQVKAEKLAKLKSVKEQRKYLDVQMEEKDAYNEELSRARKVEAESVAKEVQKFKHEEAAGAEKKRLYLSQIKLEREAQVQAHRSRKKEEEERRRAEEAKEIAEVKAKLEEDKMNAHNKKVTFRKEMMAFIADNESRAKAKSQAEILQKEEDEKMRLAYVKMLEDQDRAREAALQAMYEKSQGRAEVVGEQVTKMNKAREDAENAMLQKIREQHERELDEAERFDKKRREEMIEEVKSTRERQMREQEAAMLAERREIEKYFESVRLKDEHENQEEIRRQQRRREDNVHNRHFLSKQMKEAEQRMIVDDVLISEPEKRMNADLLEQAKLMVGYEENPELLVNSVKI